MKKFIISGPVLTAESIMVGNSYFSFNIVQISPTQK